MNYVLKKAKLKKGLYLQIYKSIYNPETKNNKNILYKTLGYVDNLIAEGIKDPVEYYKNVVKKMNEEQKEKEKENKTLIASKKIMGGMFILNNIFDSLLDLKDNDLYEDIKNNVVSSSLDICKEQDFEYYYYRQVIDKTSQNTVIQFLEKEYESLLNSYKKNLFDKYSIDKKRIFYSSKNLVIDYEIYNVCYISSSSGIPLDICVTKNEEEEKIDDLFFTKNIQEKNKNDSKIIFVGKKEQNFEYVKYKTIEKGNGYILSVDIDYLSEEEIEEIYKVDEIESEKEYIKQGWTVVKDKYGNYVYGYKTLNNKLSKNYSYKGHDFSVTERRILIQNPIVKEDEEDRFTLLETTETDMSVKEVINAYYNELILQEETGKTSLSIEVTSSNIKGLIFKDFLSYSLIKILHICILENCCEYDELLMFLEDFCYIEILDYSDDYLLVTSNCNLINKIANYYKIGMNRPRINKKIMNQLKSL